MLNLANPYIRVGNTARFPLGKLGDEQVYRYRWAVTAFKTDGSIVVRRLHDGIERTISARWFEQYRTEERRSALADDGSRQERRKAGLAQLRARRLTAPLQTDPTQPGFYVSAIKGKQYALLLGPFVSLYDARQLVQAVWPIVREYDDPWCEVGVGTCRVEESRVQGKFNQRLLGKGIDHA